MQHVSDTLIVCAPDGLSILIIDMRVRLEYFNLTIPIKGLEYRVSYKQMLYLSIWT